MNDRFACLDEGGVIQLRSKGKLDKVGAAPAQLQLINQLFGSHHI